MLKVKQEHGFTIVELMIATAVFSTVLVVVTAGIVTFSRQYYKGIVTNSTQSTTRNAMNEISQSIQFRGGAVEQISGTADDGTRGFCINDKPYYYILGRQIDGPNSATRTNHALVTATNDCSVDLPNLTWLDFASSGLTNPRELLGERMRLAAFGIQNGTTNGTTTATVTIRVTYGDDDLLCSNTAFEGSCNNSALQLTAEQFTKGINDLQCRGEEGSQFCATAGLNANVAVRLK